MITCRFAGGLGNNLYQLAFLINNSEKYNIPYYITSDVDRSNIPSKSKQSRKLEFYSLFENRFTVAKNLNYDFSLIKDHYHVDLNPSYNHLYSEVKIEPNTRYHGYFLSDKHFSDFDMKKKLIFNKKIKNELIKKYKPLMKKPTISLHYRLAGDRQLNKIKKLYNIIDPSYYKKAIQMILKKTNTTLEDYNIILFSDDILLASELVKEIKIGLYISSNSNNIQDFIHMSLCDFNIIGNSTFSWWSAYLNENNRAVFYPKDKWFSEDLSHIRMDDMFPTDWIGL